MSESVGVATSEHNTWDFDFQKCRTCRIRNQIVESISREVAAAATTSDRPTNRSRTGVRSAMNANNSVEVEFHFPIDDSPNTFDQAIGFVVCFALPFDVGKAGAGGDVE